MTCEPEVQEMAEVDDHLEGPRAPLIANGLALAKLCQRIVVNAAQVIDSAGR